MLGGITKIIEAMANKPLFGTKLRPKDAAVDPSLFPEDEYPVHCPKCLYPLRGLPDGNCPECGEPFTRGRLLVFEYVEGGWFNKWWKSRPGRWCVRLFWIGAVAPIVAVLVQAASLMIQLRRPPSVATTPTQPADLLPAPAAPTLLFTTFLFMSACMLAVAIIAVCSFPGNRRKRRRAVLKAYDEAA